MKWRLFESFRLGSSDPDVERLYLWHIAARRNANRSVGVGMDANKASDAAYIPAAKALYQSMVAKGFDPAFPVPVDPNGELLGGAHRVACALALKIESIVVEHQERLVWAPAWGEQWFAQHGLSGEDLERLRSDFEFLANKPEFLQPSRF